MSDARGMVGSTLAHHPVLLAEVLTYLDPKPGEHTVDATVGAGGHSAAILARTAPDGKLLAIDLDAPSLDVAEEHLRSFGERVTFIHDSFDRLDTILHDAHYPPPDCILADLGVSSLELGSEVRGFSFQVAGAPLDMRFDTSVVSRDRQTAAELLNSGDERELVRILWEYGEETRSRQIAKAIVEQRKRRPFATVSDLIDVVMAVYRGRRGRIHPATKTFQAIRIAVNDELGRLERFLPQAIAALQPGGRLCVISFHSLEDRIVKRYFRDQSKTGIIDLLTKHPAAPSFAEVTTNPRSRSAKLRAVVRKSWSGLSPSPTQHATNQ